MLRDLFGSPTIDGILGFVKTKQSMCCRIHEVRVYSFVPPRDSKCGRNIPHLAAPLYTTLIVLIATSLTDALSRIAATIKLEDIPNSVERMTIIC